MIGSTTVSVTWLDESVNVSLISPLNTQSDLLSIVISAFLLEESPDEVNLYWNFKSSIEASLILISSFIGSDDMF